MDASPVPPLPASAQASGARWSALAAAYFGYFGMLGVLQPYLATLVLEHGLAAERVGASVAAFYVAAGLSPLLATAWAARARLGARTAYLVASGVAVALAGFASLGAGILGAPGYVALLLGLTAAYAPVNALLDTAALQACEARGWSFGRLRLMGSLGYIVAASALGRLLPAGPVGPWVHPAAAALLAAVCACGAWLPHTPLALAASDEAAARPTSPAAARAHPDATTLACLLAALGLHYASFGPFQYGFTLYGRQVGLSPWSIGLGWSLGVASEVVAFSLAGPLLRRFGWRPLLLVAFAVAPLRWTALATLPAPATFFLSQLGHGPAFALFYAAAMAALTEVTPSARAARSQTVFCALVAGLASGPAMLLAGYASARLSLGAMFVAALPLNALSLGLLLLALRRLPC